jgi:hypothetical protein
MALGSGEARAEPLRLQAQLIWGTDGPKPAGASCRDLDPALRKRLARVFKWKHYYEIRRREVTVSSKRVKRLEMSDKCLLKFSLPEKGMVEVQLIGEGRLTKTMRQPAKALRNGELLVLAGETKDNINDAWFVVISEAPPPEPPKPKEAGTPRPR